MSSELRGFVHDALSRGIDRTEIRRSLAEAGWPADEVEPALAEWAEIPFAIPVPRRKPYVSAREAFLYLVMFVTLYITAFNVGVLWFEAIERWVPDPARRGFGGARFSPESVRNGVAAVVIAFPIFLFLSRLIGTALRREPEKRASRIRKWLTYLTLFVAALVIIGDLTFLVSRLLSGELPPRFLLKTLVVLVIAGTAFGHFLADLRQEEHTAPSRATAGASPLARAAAAGVMAALVVGFVLAGSPGQERARQLDVQRVSDLQAISFGVDAYFAEHQALPHSLAVIADQPNARVVIEDPASRAPYTYRIVEGRRYELCATFDREDLGEGDAARPIEPSPRFWRHGAGRACFTLEAPRKPEPGTIATPR